MSEIDEALDRVAEDFALLEDPLEQLGYVRDLGRALPPMAEAEKTEANRLHGCASPAWLASEITPEGRVRFRGEADAILPRGVVALLLHLYSERKPDDILAVAPVDAMGRLGLSRMLSMNRVSGLAAMGARIQRAAAEAVAAHPMP